MAETVHIKELVRDLDLYPRSKIDNSNISMLVDAIREGVELPPVIVDRRSHKLVDGFHRVGANERLFGEDEALIEVEWRDYADDAEIFREAARLNAVQGKKLSSYDQDICASKAESLGIPLEAIAMDLSIPADKLRRRVTLSGSVERRPGVFDVKPIPLKRDFRHLQGQTLDQSAIEAHAKATGAGVMYSARDVIRRIESGTINWRHESIIKTLRELREILVDLPALNEDSQDAA